MSLMRMKEINRFEQKVNSLSYKSYQLVALKNALYLDLPT